MIPVRDENPTRRFAILTLGLIAVNVAVFLFQIQKPDDASLTGQLAFACEYGLVPEHLIGDPAPAPPDTCVGLNQEHGRFLGLFSSQFLHGGWFHLVGNMLFLWVFGNNIEDHLGRLRFLPFYLTVGVAAGVAQALSAPSSEIPVIGASGAISGILGAYLVLYPRKRVWTIVLPFFFVPFRLPAWLWLGIYLVLQFAFLGAAATADIEGEGGVAYLAHIGGFVAGAALIKLFAVGREPPGPRLPTVAGPAPAREW
jgi:membrane associated rhomboid family serine protease